MCLVEISTASEVSLPQGLHAYTDFTHHPLLQSQHPTQPFHVYLLLGIYSLGMVKAGSQSVALVCLEFAMEARLLLNLQ